MKLWRAADNDYIGHTASFAADMEHAVCYMDNPGFGGDILYSTDVEPQNVLDLFDSENPMHDLLSALGMAKLPSHVLAANTVDVAVPQLQTELEDAGYEWVRVRDSYPDTCETWIWISGDEPEMEEIQ